ncbi:MAG TPA: CofH family radical SAM protein [Candidatus Poseidoniaceae archaeon]|nr:MAG: CofH family radical SAM protein [Euryarchaeota archaeon TMED141]DAC15903.1 MAG TPA: CofH family radical SAM protein [Candidatus Poseidoniales archaeon]HII97367.1 CofH family radical SAM protein [Candidatus Poseidoniaceae archaeon]|tara:strand:+ start:1466 stop:2677 length:1212 start_codon:yes stop_codon:yes gene_type:complete
MGAVRAEHRSAGASPAWAETFHASLTNETWSDALSPVVNTLLEGGRLGLEHGLLMYHHADLPELGRLAHLAKEARFGNRAFFNHNVHINPTNVCALACRFCAFRRSKRQDDAYAFSTEAYVEDLGRYADHVTEVHSVGGLHPDWDVTTYEAMFSGAKAAYPHVSIKALTAVEVKHLAQQSNLSVRDTLQRLFDAGLDQLPGGGAEILDDDVRAIICNGKESSQEYLDIHATVHELGHVSNCTMLFGTVETLEQRVVHMLRLRDVADATGGFQCFVPYPFLPDDTRLPEAQLATGAEVLRTIAVSRLMLDSIPHIKAYRMNVGDGLGELALRFGADDIDGTVHKESIMHLAGSTAPLDADKRRMARLIEDAGAEPWERNSDYTSFTRFVPPPVPQRRGLTMAAD